MLVLILDRKGDNRSCVFFLLEPVKANNYESFCCFLSVNTTINYSELLGPHGPFAENLTDFTVREGQQQMATLVQTAIDDKQTCVIEAPSGLGKTWGYLVPILLSSNKAVISTAGHYLQKQLYQRDIPSVQSCLGLSRKIVLLKGRHNYICPHYLKKHLESGTHVAKAPKSLRPILSHLLQRFRETDNGDLTALKPDKSLLPYLSCSDEECLGKTCPEYHKCPLMNARQRAIHADIVIINHSLLLSLNHNGKESFIDSADTILIDEAHRLLEFGQNMAGSRLSSRQLRWFFRNLRAAIKLHASEDASIVAYIQATESWLSKLSVQIPPLSSDYLTQHRAIVLKCIKLFGHLQRWFTVASERAFELKQLSLQSAQLLNALNVIVKDDGLCWLQAQGRGFVIQNTPVHSLDYLQPLLQRYNSKTWLFTSATLSISRGEETIADNAQAIASKNVMVPDADRFLTRLGLGAEVFHRLASPFDIKAQARLYLGDLKGSPDQSAYYPSFAQLLDQFIAICPGRVLVLFSSHKALMDTMGLLPKAHFNQDHKPVLLAQKNSKQAVVDNYRLVDTFRQHKHAVLLATGSFWEGVDLSGAKLSAVVIDKLPFASPLEPLVSLRSQYLEHHGVDCFHEYMLPEAIIKLRQGCGRLLRREDDKGVIMLADPRVRNKDYGQSLIKSLPVMPVCHNLDEVSDFFNEKT